MLKARQWRRVCGEGDSRFTVARVRVACGLNIVSRDNGGSIESGRENYGHDIIISVTDNARRPKCVPSKQYPPV